MSHKQEDCYFFFNCTCTKGDRCPFGHCEATKGSRIVCKFWLQNRCLKKACRFQHMYVKKNHREVQSNWEKQPGGCRKPQTIRQHTVLQAKSKTPHEDILANPSPSDVTSGQKKKLSGNVCSADAEQPHCKHFKKNHREVQRNWEKQPGGCGKPQNIRQHTVLQAKSKTPHEGILAVRMTCHMLKQICNPFTRLAQNQS
ncbi:zinc finger CCCH domain-containing protein 11B-like isoform X2 [Ictalurus furcatus]|uniref:zinc finger CCCH domain-containing protein 11B-like isoform X2 n=1 Tax=Ictalurus furcatus TaxID=66913 RepID=UPI0023505A24|nr:zinc finger CCCH domain-containing protein 11B-like isoform X2 [Ictalurus furcatus]